MRTRVPVTFLDLIEFQSFASLWYWLFVGLVWTRRMSVTLGVNVNVLRHARQGHATAQRDLETLVGMELQNHGAITSASRHLAVTFWSFVLSALLVLALGYDAELAQAVLLLVVPLMLVWWLEERLLQRLEDIANVDELCQRLFRLRNMIQAIGMSAVFFSAIWGMFYTLSHFKL